jgi:hypothetical protein
MPYHANANALDKHPRQKPLVPLIRLLESVYCTHRTHVPYPMTPHTSDG